MGFVAISLPYIIFLHSNLDSWTYSGRTSGTVLLLSGQFFDENSTGDFFLDPKINDKNDQSSIKSLVVNAGSIAKRLFKGLRDSERNMVHSFGFIGISLFGIGIFRFLADKKFKELWICLIILSPILAVALAQGGSGNYLIQFYFLIILFCAIGASWLINELLRSYNLTQNGKKILVIIILGLASLHIFIQVPQNYLFTPRENLPREYELIGIWIKHNIPEINTQTILSRKPATASCRFFCASDAEYPQLETSNSGA